MRANRRVLLCCTNCHEIFSRAKGDAKKSKGSYCSARCQAIYRTGFKYVRLACETCLTMFEKVAAQARRCTHHFCSTRCYWATVDRVALGRLGSAAPRTKSTSAYVRFRRSQAGGAARARSLSKERLREIALLGVAARRARGSISKPFSVAPSDSARLRRGLQFLGPLITNLKGTR